MLTMPMPSLAEFQRDFAATLLEPGVGGLFHELPAGLRVHRNTTIKGLVDALLANYPTVGVLMGQEWLADVARSHALQHPPQQAVLADYGDRLPDFLRSLQVAEDWPYLPAVAELDRAWTQSLLATDAPSLTPEKLASLAPDALATVQLRLHPATRFGVYPQSAVTVWMHNRPPAVPPAELLLDSTDEAALIVRSADGVKLLPLNVAGRAFIEAIIAGHGLVAAASRALEVSPTADMANIWSTLLTHGAFADLEH
jgi:hypothetical protein